VNHPLNPTGAKQRLLAMAACGALAGCAATTASGDAALVLYDGRPDTALQVEAAEFQVSESQRGSGKALTLRFKDVWNASLRLVARQPLDLRPYLDAGLLEFDLHAVDLAKGGLTFAMGCGPDCERRLPWVLESRALQGRGWQHLSFPLRCFVREGHDFSAVTQPFVVQSRGSGEVALANVRIVRSGHPTIAACPDYRTESVTPAPLTEVNALDWWMPRHHQKLQELRQRKAAGRSPELVFIGDSITHGWEDVGLPVWNRHYAPYDALGLGFSGDRTENVLWRLQHGEVDGLAPKVAVLLIGTNNTGERQEDPATTAAGIRRLVDELRQRLPQTRILLLAIFPRDEQPGSRLRRINERVNTLISRYDDGRHVFFLDLNAALTHPDGTISTDVLPDLLHLSEKGYRLWAQAMEPTLSKLLSNASQ
jgi:lysophospholipase L1-like esterase